MDDIFNGMSDLSVQQVALNTDAKGRLLLIRSTQFCSNKVHHIAHLSGTANRALGRKLIFFYCIKNSEQQDCAVGCA